MNALLRAALGGLAVFLALHLFGGRAFVGVLSGTVSGGPGGLLIGLAYALAYFSAVLGVPVLALAGVGEAALEWRRRRQSPSAPDVTRAG